MKKIVKSNYFYDIFDTIVSRKIEPEYVKKIWATNIAKICSLDIDGTYLYNLRYNVEASLGQESVTKGFDCEITYKDIIRKIYDSLNIKIKFDNFYEICESEEIAIESKVLYVNEDIIKEIKKEKKAGHKVYCVSDMYLSKKMIIKMFENLKIDKYFDDIFVSSEYLYNKRSGKLYDIVLKKLKVKPENCTMIGDNFDKDCEIPKSKNMNAIHIDRSITYKFYQDFLNNNNPDKVIKDLKELSKKDNDNFNNMIFSLYNFIDKLYFKLKSENYNEVFFLAREGEYLKKLFDYYVENTYNSTIKSHYMYVSRKATYLPSLKPIAKEDFSYLLNQYSYVTVREFLKSLNLPEDGIKKIEKDLKNKLDFDTKIGWFKDSKEFKELKKSKVFQDVFETNRVEQNKLFKQYIKEFTNSKKLMIVDIGWNGSIQDNIQNILGKDYEVSGCYFGLCLRSNIYSGKKTGLVFSNDPYENKQYRLYYENRTLYEIMCGASHGSANKYVLNKDKRVEVLLFSKKEEQDIYKNVVKPAQDAMFNIFKDIVNVTSNKYYNDIEVQKVFNKIQFNLLYKPTKKQLNFFDKIYHYENFGVFEFTTFNNKSKVGIKKYIKEHIKFFLKYSTYFDDAFWPVLKLHNNKMKVPYLIYRNRRKRRYKKSNLF